MESEYNLANIKNLNHSGVSYLETSTAKPPILWEGSISGLCLHHQNRRQPHNAELLISTGSSLPAKTLRHIFTRGYQELLLPLLFCSTDTTHMFKLHCSFPCALHWGIHLKEHPWRKNLAVPMKWMTLSSHSLCKYRRWGGRRITRGWSCWICTQLPWAWRCSLLWTCFLKHISNVLCFVHLCLCIYMYLSK